MVHSEDDGIGSVLSECRVVINMNFFLSSTMKLLLQQTHDILEILIKIYLREYQFLLKHLGCSKRRTARPSACQLPRKVIWKKIFPKMDSLTFLENTFPKVLFIVLCPDRSHRSLYVINSILTAPDDLATDYKTLAFQQTANFRLNTFNLICMLLRVERDAQHTIHLSVKKGTLMARQVTNSKYSKQRECLANGFIVF